MTTIHTSSNCPECAGPIPPDAPRGLCPRCALSGALTQIQPAPQGSADRGIPALEEVSAAFPQLEILELLGRGGMGFVYKARQPRLDRFVALKLLPDRVDHDPQFAERFHREGKVLARLNHPNIVSVFDFGKTEGFYFLILEFVDGVNLRQAMQAGRFSPREALDIVPSICAALQYAHEQGILHRDIKPENILLDSRGRVKLADFGIAKLVNEDPGSITLTGTGAALGTPHYMAPEQFESPSEVDHRADIYSLGVVFYEMLTGELPLGRFEPPSAKTPVSKPVDEVVFRTLEKDRAKRFQSAGEVKSTVEHLTSSGAVNPSVTQQDSADDSTGVDDPELEALKGRICFRAMAGAGLVGASLLQPLALAAGQSQQSASIWLTLAGVAMPGLGGTLVGWLGLNEIRDSAGRLRGLPFALFATLAWPLIALVVVTIFLARNMLGPGGNSPMHRIAMLIIPAAVVTFSIWAIYSLARWATKKPEASERGILKWVFAGILVAGILLAPAVKRKAGSQAPESVPAPAPSDLPSLRIEPDLKPGQPAAERLRDFSWMLQLQNLSSLNGQLLVTSNGVPVDCLKNSFSLNGPVEFHSMSVRAKVRSRGVVPPGEPAWDLIRGENSQNIYTFTQSAPVRWWVAASAWPVEFHSDTNFNLVLFRGIQETGLPSSHKKAVWEATYIHQISTGLATPASTPTPEGGSLEFKLVSVSRNGPDKFSTRVEWLHRAGCTLTATLWVLLPDGIEYSNLAAPAERPEIQKAPASPSMLNWELPNRYRLDDIDDLAARFETQWKDRLVSLIAGEELVWFEDVLEDGTCIQARLRAVKE